MPDLAVAITDGGLDQAPPVDLVGMPPVDLAGADLAGADLATSPDLALPSDMNGQLVDLRVTDLARARDLLSPIDLLPAHDLDKPRDLLPPPDLDKPRDLLPPPDLDVRGHLACSVATTGAMIDLTTGLPPNTGTTDTLDWAHWGTNDTTTIERRSGGGTRYIGDYAAVGSGTYVRYTDSGITYTWENGTPDATSNGTITGIYVGTKGNGFALPIAADTTSHTAQVYVSGFNADLAMTAHLSDGSATDYTNAQAHGKLGSSNYLVYTCTYNSASAGSSLTFTWTNTRTFAGSNVTIQSAVVE